MARRYPKPGRRPVLRNPIAKLSRLGREQYTQKLALEFDPITSKVSRPDYHETPIYDSKTGMVLYKDAKFTREEAKRLRQLLTSVPVSGGRFPTEADLMLNTWRQKMASVQASQYVPPSLKHIAEEQITEQIANNPGITQWRENLVKATDTMQGITETETAAKWKEVGEKIQKLSNSEFIMFMDRYGDEIQISFKYDIAQEQAYVMRVEDLIDRFMNGL